MTADVIVGASIVFTLVFVAAWAWRPDLRAWLERPKYQFHDAVGRYDRVQAADDRKGDRPA